MVKRIFFYILLLCLVSVQIFAQEFRVRAESDSSKYLIGDYIQLKYEITHEEGVKYSLPSIKDSLSELTFIREAPFRQYTKDEKIIDEYTFIFSRYDSAGVVVPSIQFKYETTSGEIKTSYSNEVAFDVITLDVNTQEEIQDVKSPLKIPLDWISILIYILVILSVAGLGYFIYHKYWKKKTEEDLLKPELLIPPHEEALKALYKLDDEKLWQQGKIKEYHSSITHIIRHYFERRFNFLALEMPSSDVLKKLKDINGFDQLYAKTEDFFNNADMVKFAKFQPRPSVNEQMIKQAIEIVNTTKEVESQPSEETANV